MSGASIAARGPAAAALAMMEEAVQRLVLEGWAGAVAAAARSWGADRVVAEANNGGKMVESVLRACDAGLPVRLVHANRGKVARAEPVAAQFEKGRARFAGGFPALEDEIAGLTIGGGYEGPGRSPDRADDEQVAMSPGHGCAVRGTAHLLMVWAMTELMLGKAARTPRVSLL